MLEASRWVATTISVRRSSPHSSPVAFMASLIAVGEQHEHVAFVERHAPPGVRTLGHQADDGSSDIEAQDVVTSAAVPEEERRIVTRVHVLELARGCIVLGVEERGIPVRRRALVHKPVQVRHHPGEFGHAVLRLPAHEGTERGHQQRRGHALARNVADGDAQLRVGEPDEVVVVAAHPERRPAGAGIVQSGDWRTGLRKQSLLHFACAVQFAMPLDAARHFSGNLLGQPAVLDGQSRQTADHIAGVVANVEARQIVAPPPVHWRFRGEGQRGADALAELDDALRFELPVGPGHGARTDHQFLGQAADSRQRLAGSHCATSERILHLVNELQVYGNA